MAHKRVPDPETVIAELRAFLIVLYEAFESAAQRTREFFEQNGMAVNLHLQAHLIRAFVADYLRKRGQELTEFDQDDLPNSGIELVVSKYQVRLWKSDHGQLPPPGRSKARRRFQSQIIQFILPIGELARRAKLQRQVKFNLALVWDLNPTGNLTSLRIAAPNGVDGTRAKVYWLAAVPHPAELMQVSAAQPFTATDDDDELAIVLSEENELTAQLQELPFIELAADDVPLEFTDEGETPTEEAK